MKEILLGMTEIWNNITNMGPPPRQLLDMLRELTNKLLNDEYSQHGIQHQNLDYFHFRLDNLQNLILRCNKIYNIDDALISSIRSAVSICDGCVENSSGFGYFAPKISSSARGRPKYLLTKPQLEYYLENDFNIPKIAEMVSVSQSTIKRRLKDFGLSIQSTYTLISDPELDRNIGEIISKNPNCGYRPMHGFLISEGITVSERRIQESLHRVDAEGVLMRALQLPTINRRKYQVPGILSLWHIDGHHKLIRLVCFNGIYVFAFLLYLT